ncbi:hypothetical protein BKA80DRAFT_262609 [Phyllosticta citrichinensis]
MACTCGLTKGCCSAYAAWPLLVGCLLLGVDRLGWWPGLSRTGSRRQLKALGWRGEGIHLVRHGVIDRERWWTGVVSFGND